MDSKYQSLPFESEKSPVTSSEICSSLADSDDLDFEKHEVDPRTSSVRERLSPALLWPVHAVLFMMSFTFFVLALTLRPTTLDHVQQFSAWSPAEAAVRYEKVKYNITTDDNNPFVGAGRTVDKAWREISYDVGDQWISKAEIAKLGMPKTSLKVNHPTTGVEGYRVGMEVFHHLHCLNLLRRVTYREYYEPLGGEFAEGPEALKGHTDHCLEVLRLNLLCNADIGVFTLYMIPGDPLAWPELNSNHVCRNFDNVRQWALGHSVGNMEAGDLVNN